MIKKTLFLLCVILKCCSFSAIAQINTDRVMIIGRNALYYEDYVLSIQYFNQVIKAKPYLAEPYFYRAIAKFYLDDTKGAEDDCSLAIERNPFFVNAYQLRADARLSREEYAGAINDYKNTLDYSPDNRFALINLGVAYIQSKNYDEAQNTLDELVRVYPKYTQGFLVRGSMNLERGDTLQALEDYNKAIETDKHYSQAYSMRGILYYNQKQYEKALADLDEAIKLDPLVPGNYINRGLVRYSSNDLRGAMEDYDKVVNEEPNNIIARFNRGLLRAQIGDDNRAISDFDVVLQHEPDNYIAYVNRAILKDNIADYKGALSDWNIVLKEYPDFYQGFYMRSELKRRMNDLRGAEKDYLYARNEEDKMQRQIALNNNDSAQKNDKKASDGKTREQSDKDIDKFNLLVVSDTEEQQKNKYKNEARGRVQDRQVRIEPETRFVITYYEKPSDFKNFVHYNAEVDNINKRNILSRKLIITNQEVPLTQAQIDVHFASINEYSKLIAENPTDPDLLFARGIDYMLVQNFSDAINDFNEVIKLDPKFILAYFNLAVVHSKQLELKQYMPDYNNIRIGDLSLEDAAKDASGLSIQASRNVDAEKRLVDYHFIMQNYNTVLELDADFVYAYYNRAEIRTMQKDYRAAILDYNEALRREPDFPEAYFNRGLNRLQLGEKEKGLENLRKAGELGILNAYNIIKRMTE